MPADALPPDTLIPQADLDALKAVAGPDGWSEDPHRLAPKLREWREPLDRDHAPAAAAPHHGGGVRPGAASAPSGASR